MGIRLSTARGGIKCNMHGCAMGLAKAEVDATTRNQERLAHADLQHPDYALRPQERKRNAIQNHRRQSVSIEDRRECSLRPRCAHSGKYEGTSVFGRSRRGGQVHSATSIWPRFARSSFELRISKPLIDFLL
ncbi:hypothetical protein DENSPDRAFT_683696 [Dentipellis sp. KUC8613]|nr:hypothetical protein DENSPDRAFT_683696 [Dentipellis sp. KUC8613]